MGTWEEIFKEKGKVFHEPQEDLAGVIDLLRKEKVQKVLDLGCGSGRHAVMLAIAGFEVYGMDISATGLKITCEWLKKEGLSAKLKKGSCYSRFPYKDNYFDAVVSVQVIHHNYHDKIKYCISEIERILKPGGLVFITTAKRKTKYRAAKSKLVAPRTYVPVEGPENGLPHFIYTKQIMLDDFKNFSLLDFYVDKTGHYCFLGKLKK